VVRYAAVLLTRRPHHELNQGEQNEKGEQQDHFE
jgi:hypothetical protein